MKKIKSKLTVSALVILFLSLALSIACSKGNGNFNTNQMLSDTVNNMIIPIYDDITVSAFSLKNTLDAFADNPTATTLTNAQESWKEAKVALKKAEVISFGPYVTSKFEGKMDFKPTRPGNIEEAIANNTDFSEDVIISLGASVVGLPAIEYLIFTDLNFYTSDALALNRRAFLKAVGDYYLKTAQGLEGSWASTSTNFATSFVDAGVSSTLYPTQQSAITEMVNQMAFLVEGLKDTKLGKPMGKQNGGDPAPELVESPYSHHSIEDMMANLEGLKFFYTGSNSSLNGLSLYDLMRTKNDYLAGLVIVYIDDSIDALSSIQGPLDEAVTLHPEQTEEAYKRLTYLKASIQTHVSGLLGITPYFSDNDGD